MKEEMEDITEGIDNGKFLIHSVWISNNCVPTGWL